MLLAGAMSRYRRYLIFWGYAFLAPAFFLYLLVDLYPLLWAFKLSLERYSIFAPPQFVGLANYAKMLQDPLFWKSLQNTLFWTVVVVPAIILISLPWPLCWMRPGSASSRSSVRSIFSLW